MNNPIETINGIYKHFGYVFNEKTKANIIMYLKENPINKYGVHKYNLDEYSITDDMINNSFREYRKMYNV